jgi:hypothetical protein
MQLLFRCPERLRVGLKSLRVMFQTPQDVGDLGKGIENSLPVTGQRLRIGLLGRFSAKP